MTAASLNQIVTLGAITGMRSMAGPAALALTHGGSLTRLVPLLAAGEMVADKTSLVGDRIDTLPLAGRALMGALVGGVIARADDGNLLLGGVIGGVTAVTAAHLAYHARRRLPVSNALGGVLEDALVMGIALFSGYGRYRRRADLRRRLRGGR
jgi:uncharacterized membrane protein